MLILLLLAAAATAESDSANLSEERKLKSRSESYNRVVEIDGKTYVYYAQNSPEYGDIWIGDGYKYTVAQSTCACHALANCMVNSLNYETLPEIRQIATSPIRIDTRNILMGRGVKEEESFEICRNEDFFRYYPLVLINLSGGNNASYGRYVQFASPSYFQSYLAKSGLTCEVVTKDLDRCMEAVEKEGAMVISCTAGSGSPIARQFGHYLTMAHVSGDQVWFLDSLARDTYPLDSGGIIHVQEPGVIWVAKEDVQKLSLLGSSYIVYPAENRTEYTPEMYAELIRKSNEE